MKVNKKQFVIIGSVALLLIAAFSFYHKTEDKILFTGFDHEWKEYVNKELGFTVMYPSDIAQPYEAKHPTAETVTFYEDDSQSKYIFLWVEETRASTAQEWFKFTHGSDGSGYYISATSTIAGVPAVSVREVKPGKGPGNYNLHFVHKGSEWSLYIDDSRLSQETVQHIHQSFRFLNWWEKL